MISSSFTACRGGSVSTSLCTLRSRLASKSRMLLWRMITKPHRLQFRAWLTHVKIVMLLWCFCLLWKVDNLWLEKCVWVCKVRFEDFRRRIWSCSIEEPVCKWCFLCSVQGDVSGNEVETSYLLVYGIV